MSSLSEVKLSLTCSHCSKIYKDPIELTCGDFICQAQLKENEVVKQNKIKCSVCCQEFRVKNNDFKSNESIQKQVDDKIYLNEEEKALFKKIEESIKVFFDLYDDFNSNNTLLDLDCHNHFQEIRFQLDIHREKLKQKVDNIYMIMIDKTKEFEKSYLKSFNEKLTASIKSLELKSVDDHLKDLEETFRNPNLLIESIQTIQIKQQEAQKSIQSKMNELDQIKESLKESNQFIPYSSFNTGEFGQLNLTEYSRDPFESKILEGQQHLELLELCEFNLGDEFKLLYRGSEHGFKSDDFHSKSDGHANTLTIIKTSESSFIFGGFTTASWNSSGKYKSDPNAFLFSLTNKDNEPCKMKIYSNKHEYAIFCDPTLGPAFGYLSPLGNDIIISNSSNEISSYSYLGSTYKHPQYAYQSDEAESFLAGSIYFLLSEIEVYQKK